MLKKIGVSSSNYEGPTTICSLISQRAAGWGAENMTMIVSLPQYTHLEEDYIGAVRVQEIIAQSAEHHFHNTYGKHAGNNRNVPRHGS